MRRTTPRATGHRFLAADVAGDDNLTAALTALRAVGRRSSVARGLQGGVEQRLLQSIVDATASLFDAEASSIALFETDPDRLEFRVAAGAHGAGAVGLQVKPTEGIAGFVFSTGQALALSDVASDPRFDLEAAERTGYIPRSVAAVPLLDDEGSVGVLQVLDKRSSASFSLRDMELLAIFASQATTAITAARVQRDTGRLLEEVLRQLSDGAMTDAQIEALVSDVTQELDDHPEAPFWRLVDHVSSLRGMGERDLTLVGEILEVVARHAHGARRRG
jgi:GAF domain-containing protein